MARELDCAVENWSRARRIRDFLQEYESTRSVSAPAKEWLDAARQYANSLDPLTNGSSVERDLDPSDEFLEQLIEEEKRLRVAPQSR